MHVSRPQIIKLGLVLKLAFSIILAYISCAQISYNTLPAQVYFCGHKEFYTKVNSVIQIQKYSVHISQYLKQILAQENNFNMRLGLKQSK